MVTSMSERPLLRPRVKIAHAIFTLRSQQSVKRSFTALPRKTAETFSAYKKENVISRTASSIPARKPFSRFRPPGGTSGGGKSRRQFPDERKKTVSSETQILSHTKKMENLPANTLKNQGTRFPHRNRPYGQICRPFLNGPFSFSLKVICFSF